MDTKPLLAAIEKRAFDARVSISALCSMAGVSPAASTAWRKPDGSRPSLATIGKLERALAAIEQGEAA